MRCFVAIELPEAVRARLGALRSRLRELDRAVRWTRTEQIHLTLHFLGEVPDNQVATVCQATQDAIARLEPDAGMGAFELEVSGLGCFPAHGPPRVIWAGIAGPPAPLLRIHQEIGAAYAALGFPPEQRAYHPHLTLGRTRERVSANTIRQVLAGWTTFSAGTFVVRELVVFQSILGADGAMHVPLSRVALTA